MTAKTVPVSVRLSREDAAFIAALKAEGAVTMSEKVRHLVGEARVQSECANSFEGVHQLTQDQLAPLRKALQDLDASTGQSSAVLDLMLAWTPKLVAEMEASDTQADKELLCALEARVSQRLFELLDRLARLGTTQEAPCLDPKVVRKTLTPLTELLTIIHNNPADEE